MITLSKTAIRRFIIAIGAISLLISIASIGSFDFLAGAALVIMGLTIILNILTLIVGIKFNTWVVTKPKAVTRFFWVYIAWTVANSIYAYSVGPVGWGSLLFTLIYVAAIVYIIRSIKGFSEVQSSTAL